MSHVLCQINSVQKISRALPCGTVWVDKPSPSVVFGVTNYKTIQQVYADQIVLGRRSRHVVDGTVTWWMVLSRGGWYCHVVDGAVTWQIKQPESPEMIHTTCNAAL